MTVHAADVTFLDLTQHADPSLRDRQNPYSFPLHLGIPMVEFENKYVALTAIDARMRL